jgi:hypothetical protein
LPTLDLDGVAGDAFLQRIGKLAKGMLRHRDPLGVYRNGVNCRCRLRARVLNSGRSLPSIASGTSWAPPVPMARLALATAFMSSRANPSATACNPTHSAHSCTTLVALDPCQRALQILALAHLLRASRSRLFHVPARAHCVARTRMFIAGGSPAVPARTVLQPPGPHSPTSPPPSSP